MAEVVEDEDLDITTALDSQPKMMAPALISSHPHGKFVVVAIGPAIRVFDFSENIAVVLSDKTSPSGHRDAIRSIVFNKNGSQFTSAGDDKLVKLWDVSDWHCTKTIRLQKKVSAVAFTQDSKWLLFADKFGVVYVLSTKDNTESEEPVQLLAHCCSIITSLVTSPDERFIITADRDFKIRISVLPKRPTSGAREIHAFCLGHTNFVSCLAFIGSYSGVSLLISAGGDATIRLWDYSEGSLLDTFDVANANEAMDGLVGGVQHGLESHAVLGIATSQMEHTVAAIIEGFYGVLLLRCDIGTKKLFPLQTIILEEKVCPTSLQFDQHGNLWVVAGAAETMETVDSSTPEATTAMEAKARAIALNAVARVVNLSPIVSASSDAERLVTYKVGSDDTIPGGKDLLEALQGNETSVAIAAIAAAAAEAAESATKTSLSKRQYSEEHRELRKQRRNDKKLSREPNGQTLPDKVCIL